MKESRKEHWEAFWSETGDLSLDDVYDNGGRILREVFAAADPSGLRVLEVGAGTGRDSVALAAAGAEVVTLDYAPRSLGLIRDAADSAGVQVHMVGGDGLRLPFPDGTFDLVFHQGLLEHFRDPLPLLRENVRVLKEGGRLLVDVPQRYHYYTLGKHTLMLFDRWFAGWETEFSIGELEGRMREVGLVCERSYGDWMVPGLFYRALRKVLLKGLGWRLPMYPRPLPILGTLSRRWREWFSTRRASLYTTIVIGVIGRKPSTTRSES
jgi:SAM-dependent methyltransferase